MRAMSLRRVGEPLQLTTLPDPEPAPGELLVEVAACGVCRTDLHIFDGELTEPKLPLVLGHQIVGRVRAVGSGVDPNRVGERVGVPWLGYTCNACSFCARGQENLCDAARFTGYQRDGGFAELAVADARYSFRLAEDDADEHVAPLLCAGLIGYRSLRMCGEAERLGLYGFGAAAHIVLQVAQHRGVRVGALVRPGDDDAKAFAMSLGASWAVGSDEPSPEELDAAIVFAPVGALVVHALRSVRKGGVVVCGGIHMSDIPSFAYELLWGERVVRSVANLTRRDAEELLALAPTIPIRTDVERYALEELGSALDDLRGGKLRGAAVAMIRSPSHGERPVRSWG